METNKGKTIRLKKNEVLILKEISFKLTKEAIMNGHQKIFTEADLVHYLLQNFVKNIVIDNEGNLEFKK